MSITGSQPDESGFPRPTGPAVWQLDELRTHYEWFVEEFGSLRQRVRDGQVTASEALIMRTEVMNAWWHFPREDPDLPAEFMPADWLRPAAHELFHEIYDGLGPKAEVRVAQVVTSSARSRMPSRRPVEFGCRAPLGLRSSRGKGGPTAHDKDGKPCAQSWADSCGTWTSADSKS